MSSSFKNDALLTDLYQLTMLQSYLDHEMQETAVFELFVRRLPANRNFLVLAGLEQVLEYLENLQFSQNDISWLADTGRFNSRFLSELESFRFTGDVHAMPEGTVFFPQEPILRITAPLPQAQIVESRLSISSISRPWSRARRHAAGLPQATKSCWISACDARTDRRPQ
jgi:nicotinate phosphoribosyltransferase